MRIETCCESNKCLMFVEQYALLCGLDNSKLLRRCVQSARQHAVDPVSKVVVSAWLRYERREDELVGVSGFHCVGRVLECLKAALVDGYDPNLAFDHCKCVEINDLGGQCICRVDVKPSLFYKRKGSKCLQVNSAKIDV
ncbi:hypothetical protein POM88_012287 [Heracleum sosnowskyi]|uniref:Uncharacterized protein n=1 Tax=Heracleum sosnowskyi TaxID=360622 RepID=A0AAD8IX42_9APIA|nr:hypothetical protein POM88_012287 [Heracleum sosnowskyi]